MLRACQIGLDLGRPIHCMRSVTVAHLFSWRAILSAPLSVSFLTAPFSRTSSRSADPAEPALLIFRSDRPLAEPVHVQLTGHQKSTQMSMEWIGCTGIGVRDKRDHHWGAIGREGS